MTFEAALLGVLGITVLAETVVITLLLTRRAN